MGMNRALLEGTAGGAALVLDEPLSMWGGLDPKTGEIIDRRHPQRGMNVTGTVLVLPWGRGSSSASSVLAEAIRLGTAPCAIVLREPDDIILLGALVAEEMYDTTCPIVVVEPELYTSITTGDQVTVSEDGSVSVTSSQ
jgi:predicted aconitase with swiveling domain